MPIAEHSLALLGVVLLIGLLIPELLQRFHLPFATALIVVGAVIGPHGLDLVRADATLTVFAFLGATFQMLLAGFEARRLGNPLQRDTGVLFATTGLFPAAAAIGIALAAGLDLTAALLAGTIFMSSSILLVLSMLWHLKLQGSPLGDRISSLVVTLELAAAFGVFVLLKRVDPHPRFPLPILLGLVVSSVVFLRMFVPELVAFAFERLAPGTDEEALRRRTSFALALMLLTVFLYAGFGVHPVIGAFLAGFALASADGVEPLREKLQTIGYALFIPVFLFTIGLDVDVGMFARIDVGDVVLVGLVVAAIATKVIGGYVGGRLVHMPSRHALVLGIASTARLTVPLTATYAALKAGIIEKEFFTAMVLASVLSTVVAPLWLSFVLRRHGADIAPEPEAATPEPAEPAEPAKPAVGEPEAAG